MRASAMIKTLQRAIGAFGDLDVCVAWEGQLKETNHEHTVHVCPGPKGTAGIIVIDGEEGLSFNPKEDRPVPGHDPITVRLTGGSVRALVDGKMVYHSDNHSRLPHLGLHGMGAPMSPQAPAETVYVPLSAAEIGLLQRGGDVWHGPLRLLIVGVYLDGII